MNKLLMKKLLLLLFFSSAMFAQELKQVPKQIILLQAQNKDFKKFSLFSVNNNYDNTKFNKEVDEATIATLNQEVLNKVVAEKPEYLQFSIPYDNKKIEIVLYKVQIQTNDFQLDTDREKNVNVEKGVHYRGIINGNTNSLASFNFFKGEMNGIVSENEFNNLNIGKLEISGNKNDYIIYSDLELKKPFNFTCDVKDTVEKKSTFDQRNAQDVNSTRCVAIYFELDYKAYVQHGSNVTTTLNWFNSIFNNVQTLYANDGITAAIKSVFVWTTLDPYAVGINSTQYLNAFVNNRPVFNGDIAQLVSYNRGRFGGLAYLNGLCGTFKHGYSDIETTFATVPNYSWTVEVITHELGHQMGSEHTHACAWNGNNTAIDGCAPTYNSDLSEGNCPTGPVPYAQRGTIMSYCHLLGNVGINFANGFGIQPATRIITKINAATCLSTDCIDTCINTISEIRAQSTTQTSIVLTWADADVTATTWQVAIATYPFTNLTWTTVSTNPYTFENLIPGTYYKFFIRQICTAGRFLNPASTIIPTNVANVCGISFRDTGATSANYTDNEDWTRTFTPPAGQKAKVVFTTFDLELNYDYLYVYDGPDANSPVLALMNGIMSNVTYTATNATGALTFRFISDQYTNASGWNATISCEALGLNDFDKAGFTYYPNPVNEELVLNSKTEVEKVQIYSIDGRLVFEQKSTFNETKINTAAFSKGTYIVKIVFTQGNTGAFKIVKQ